MDSQSWRSFKEILLQCQTMEKLETFLDIFLTIAEKESIVNRYLIIKELLEHHPHREIAKHLNVSVANVSRGSNVLKTKRIEIEQLFNLT